MMDQTREALARYDAHQLTHWQVVELPDRDLLAWLDEADRLAANCAFAFAIDMAGVHPPGPAVRAIVQGAQAC